MRFGKDAPGLYLRIDHAVLYGIALDGLMVHAPASLPPGVRAVVEDLMGFLGTGQAKTKVKEGPHTIRSSGPFPRV